MKMNINNYNGAVNSSTSFESEMIEFQEIPLTALSKGSLRKLSHLLNSKKILRSEEGYERDWRGLASLSKQKFLCDESTMNGDDPLTKVIQLWCTNNPETATFAYLEKFLGIIDRWDVSDDIYENLVEDTKIYQTKLQHCLDLKTDENRDIHSNQQYGDFGRGSDPNILTIGDVIRAQKGLPPQMYDAFVLYADADLNYASEMLIKLEDNPEYDFKLCMKDRDLLAGVQFEHIALTQLIEERCKHLIVILTEEFLKSPENKFLVNYTQALQIQHKTRKIIPLLYEDNVDIPRTLKIYTHLRYNPSTDSLFNFWSKLASSIRNINMAPDLTTSCEKDTHSSSKINRQKLNIQDEGPLKNLHGPMNEIPNINIISPDGNETRNKKERLMHKPLTLKTQQNKTSYNDGAVLRNAHSTSQLYTLYQANNTINFSNLSICSETKKKKKWSSKIFKKVFNRGNPKLQEA